MDLLISIIIATIIFIIIFTSKKASIKTKAFYLFIYMIFLLYVANERQFCLSNLSFNYDEKIKNDLSGRIESLIEYDKHKREIYYQSKGYSQKQIDKIILSLENRYQDEREKIFTYCKVDDIYFIDYFIGFQIKMNSNCKVDSSWGNNLQGIGINYKFDKESYDFFNEIVVFHSQNSRKGRYLHNLQNHNSPNVKWYKKIVFGSNGGNVFSDGCHTYYRQNNDINESYIPIYTDINSSVAKKYILDTKE